MHIDFRVRAIHFLFDPRAVSSHLIAHLEHRFPEAIAAIKRWVVESPGLPILEIAPDHVCFLWDFYPARTTSDLPPEPLWAPDIDLSKASGQIRDHESGWASPPGYQHPRDPVDKALDGVIDARALGEIRIPTELFDQFVSGVLISKNESGDVNGKKEPVK